jgi:hypothetical protein
MPFIEIIDLLVFKFCGWQLLAIVGTYLYRRETINQLFCYKLAENKRTGDD